MSEVLMGFVGDVLVHRDNPREIFSQVREVLEVPDLVFANLEGVYTDDPRPVPSAPSLVSAPAHNLDAYIGTGFDVMSLANNHILDVGYDAMLETQARLRSHGMKTCGAGKCLAEARDPAIAKANGLRIAFLAYASTFPMGYEARADRPGLAPMRAYNYWRDANPNTHAPGRRPLVATIPDQTDLANLADDIRRARERADLVITSFHWGDYSRPYHLTDHEKRTARYCIDEGADLVVGHHHHVLRGMEWYRGKPILYGLGHFVFDVRLTWTEAEFKKKLSESDPAGYFSKDDFAPGPREGWPLLPMHEDARMTVMAWATANEQGVSAIGFLPCRLKPDGLVYPFSPQSAEGKEVASYLEKCNRTQGLDGRIVSESAVSLGGLPTFRVVAGRPNEK